MRKLLAIFCLAIFSFQIIPVKALGKLLASGQMTEEIHNDNCSQKNPLQEDFHKKLFTSHDYFVSEGSVKGIFNFRHFITDEALMNSLFAEVPLQPPNA